MTHFEYRSDKMVDGLVSGSDKRRVGQTSVGQTSVGQTSVAKKSRHLFQAYCNRNLFTGKSRLLKAIKYNSVFSVGHRLYPKLRLEKTGRDFILVSVEFGSCLKGPKHLGLLVKNWTIDACPITKLNTTSCKCKIIVICKCKKINGRQRVCKFNNHPLYWCCKYLLVFTENIEYSQPN
jgi:hypothetical protein